MERAQECYETKTDWRRHSELLWLIKIHKYFKFGLWLQFWGKDYPQIKGFKSWAFYPTVTSGWKGASVQNICRQGEGTRTKAQKTQQRRSALPKTPSQELQSPVRLNYIAFCTLSRSSSDRVVLGKPDKAKQLTSTDLKAEGGNWRCQDRWTQERRSCPTQ